MSHLFAHIKAGLDRLSQHPFFVGFARGMDLFGELKEPTPYDHTRDGFKQDYEAMAADWTAVGDDFRQAMGRIASEE